MLARFYVFLISLAAVSTVVSIIFLVLFIKNIIKKDINVIEKETENTTTIPLINSDGTIDDSIDVSDMNIFYNFRYTPEAISIKDKNCLYHIKYETSEKPKRRFYNNFKMKQNYTRFRKRKTYRKS